MTSRVFYALQSRCLNIYNYLNDVESMSMEVLI